MTNVETDVEDVIGKLNKEVRESAKLMDRDQARFLVDMYYRTQEHRIALMNQARSLSSSDRPTEVVEHFASQQAQIEKQMTAVLDRWSLSSEVGQWSRAQKGVGPILAAALMAYIDIERAPTVSHIWRFAGLDPTQKWLGTEKAKKLVAEVKGTKKSPEIEDIEELAHRSNRKFESLERMASRQGNPTWTSLERALALRPWSAELKVICWRLGDSFVKVSGREDAYYGKTYRLRKAYEQRRNEAGELAEQARETLETKRIAAKDTLAWYEKGMLPPGRIDLRARRYAVKLFLSHWWEIAYREHHGEEPPKPYPIAHLDHADYLAPPPGPESDG